MGVYIYVLKGPKQTVNITLPDGSIAKAGILVYSHKPTGDSFWGGKLSRWETLANARISRIAKVYEANLTPKYVVVGLDDESKAGDVLTVVDWHSKYPHHVSCYDDDGYGKRTVVGYITLKPGANRQLQVVPPGVYYARVNAEYAARQAAKPSFPALGSAHTELAQRIPLWGADGD